MREVQIQCSKTLPRRHLVKPLARLESDDGTHTYEMALFDLRVLYPSGEESFDRTCSEIVASSTEDLSDGLYRVLGDSDEEGFFWIVPLEERSILLSAGSV